MNQTRSYIIIGIWTLAFSLGIFAAPPEPPSSSGVDADGNTPLHLAVLRGDADAVEALLRAGADAKSLNTAEATPLHYAAANERIISALLAHGAPVNLRSKL